MEDRGRPAEFLSALQDIAREISLLKSALRPEKPQKSEEEQIEDHRKLIAKLFPEDEN